MISLGIVEETLFNLALLGLSTGMIIATWFGFVGSAVKYAIQFIKDYGG